MKKPKTANDWVSEMLGASRPDEIPDGWVSIADMALELGMPMRTASNRALLLVQQGKLQRRQFKVKIPGRGLSPVWYYAPVP
jgi:hypothetical protein